MAQSADNGIIAELDRAARLVGGRGFAAALFATAFFVAMLFILRADPIFTIPRSLHEAPAQDFIAFWRAGVLALHGRAADAYDPALFRKDFPQKADLLLYLNPPQFFLLIWPFSLLPYGSAKVLWMALNASALIGAAGLAAQRGLARFFLFLVFLLLSPAAFASFLAQQMNPIMAAGLLAALLLARERPLIAGAILALLTVKPQFGLLIPVFLAARGEWRAMAAAAAFSLLFALVSFAILGADVWRAFFDSFGGVYSMHAGRMSRDAFTIHQTIGKLGGGPALKLAGQLAGFLLCAAGVWIAARRWRREAAIGFALIASAFVSPSLWVYDWPIIAVGLFMLARARSPWPADLQIAASLLWAAPLITLGALSLESSFAPPAILAGTLAIVFLHRRFWEAPAAYCGSPFGSSPEASSEPASGGAPSGS